MAQARLHDQIIELLSRSHSTQESIESRITALQQASELLLYHSASNERVDEFLETILSLHVNREAPLRRFCAHFIEMLCFTRSRYACSCLEVLVTLLQDNDKQVQIFALRAARTVYKRALYWISIQQKEAIFLEAARESVSTLDFVLARMVHLIAASSKDVFCEAVRCAQSVVLSQSHSSFAPKSQAQLESAGSSCLEDLKLLEATGTALDETKLKGQADRLFTALCALLVKKRDDSAPEMEIVALIKAVGGIGHQRPAYAAGATVAFTQLAEQYKTISGGDKTKSALVSELKRLLSSRHCVIWQPRIIPVLASLGLTDANIVMQAEIERLKEQVETEQGLLAMGGAATKRRKIEGEEGERLMAISDTADAIKVPDENHAEAVFAVRAQSPAELAKIALNMLGRLPKTFEDPMTALVRVSRASGAQAGGQGFESRVRAARAMDLRVSDFLDASSAAAEVASDEEMESAERKKDSSEMRLEGSEVEVNELAGMVGSARADLFSKILFGLTGASREKKLELVRSIFKNQNVETILNLFAMVYRAELVEGEGCDLTTEDLGKMMVESNHSVADLKNLVNALPVVPMAILDYIDVHAGSNDVASRRAALMVLATLVSSRPGIALDCINRLLGHCCVSQEGARTDALKLLLAKVYRPQQSLLDEQWPYSSDSPGVPVVKTVKGSVSMLDYVCSEQVELIAKSMLEQAARESTWDKAWPMLALCSKKPKLIHIILETLIDSVSAEASIPNDVMNAFGQSLVLLPGETIDPELELIVKHYKSVRAVQKKKHRNEFLLPVLSAISTTERGLTGNLADAALSLRK
jgi:hypothetical protein